MTEESSKQPALLVTVDTEPDDEWSGTTDLSLRNIGRIPRLQEMLDRHGVRPTYFVSYSVAADPESAEVLAPIREAGRCEIGTHLHAWRTPPHEGTPPKLLEGHPYLFQYPADLQRAKFEAVHRAIQDAFGAEPTSHRAGKYGLDVHGVRLLREFKYRVDSSVTPMITWEADAQAGQPGPDFRRAPLGVYELSEDDPLRPGRSGVIEVPVSIGFTGGPDWLTGWLRPRRIEHPAARALGKATGVRKRWFRPMLALPVAEAERVGRWLLEHDVGFLNMMFHSSELIPNSRWSRDEAEVDALFTRIEQMIELAVRLGCRTGDTLTEFAQRSVSGTVSEETV